MTKVLIPTASAKDWKNLLANPEKQWKVGYSAHATAHSWEASISKGFPPEVKKALPTDLQDLKLIFAIPEYKSPPLPGGSKCSQTDVMALARNKNELAVIAVEGKVDEQFGPTLDQQRKVSKGLNERIKFLHELFSPLKLKGSIRYQLLHRTASALLIAREFHAKSAIMLVQSFSTKEKWFKDFQAFVELFKKKAEIGRSISVGEFGLEKTQLFLGWCKGDPKFLTSQDTK